jgi:hypothetical protein
MYKTWKQESMLSPAGWREQRRNFLQTYEFHEMWNSVSPNYRFDPQYKKKKQNAYNGFKQLQS